MIQPDVVSTSVILLLFFCVLPFLFQENSPFVLEFVVELFIIAFRENVWVPTPLFVAFMFGRMRRAIIYYCITYAKQKREGVERVFLEYLFISKM